MLSRSWLKHYSPAELLRIIASLLVLQVDKPMQQLQLPDVQACNHLKSPAAAGLGPAAAAVGKGAAAAAAAAAPGDVGAKSAAAVAASACHWSSALCQ